jgi:hypothetical protein
LIRRRSRLEALETVRFGLNGYHYEVVLSAKDAQQLRAAVAPFIERARTVESELSSS